MGDGQPRLLDQVRDRIRRKHYSIRTVPELLGHRDVSGVSPHASPAPWCQQGRVGLTAVSRNPPSARPSIIASEVPLACVRCLRVPSSRLLVEFAPRLF
jgi:hypothetical protein